MKPANGIPVRSTAKKKNGSMSSWHSAGLGGNETSTVSVPNFCDYCLH